MTTSDSWRAGWPPDVARSVDACLAELDSARFAMRLDDRDATLWPGDTTETGQRLGWLDVWRTMPPQRESLDIFTDRLRRDGFTDVVLLGMGGSSLGAEVLNQVLGSATGHPKLHVLDSTVPSSIGAVTRRINYAHTLFIVSSKSGGTLEPNLLCDYFYDEACARAGHTAGSQFIAITDPGSSLERKARERAFRHTFLNPPDIGGRYSVLSLFGLVPAAILGVDISRMLAGAKQMAERCAPEVAAQANPGALLGAYVAGCARLGRNKLTLLASPTLQSFGLWAEQLIAESTGKEGKGVVPIVGEPELDLDAYSSDRAFLHLRREGDANNDTDVLARELVASGFPCVTIACADTYSLGGEFYRWEYATAVAGALLGINPFDQPDVQRAKDASSRMLEYYVAHGVLPEPDTTEAIPAVLRTLKKGDYLGIMAYVAQHTETDEVFSRFRRRVATQHHVSTTLGYGPRFLHSTGQIHKGGPDGCVLIQIVSAHPDDVLIPGTTYSFGIVADAQASGDLQALLGLNRRVARIVLDADDPALLAQALGSG